MPNINKVALETSAYLAPVCSVANAPKSLYFIGKLPDQRCKTVAIVGSRKATTYGREVAYNLAFELASRGIVIVSGLALGIDAIAHEAALDAGGTTIAVLGNGLPDIYPATNRSLAHRIVASGGAILSGYDPGTPPRQYRFLERNRLESGMSDLVLIIEAAAKSGTLNTASHALEQGKEVAAVPGNITSPTSAGCNNLIKQGATPITDVSDLLYILGIDDSAQASLPFAASAEEAVILSLIDEGIRDGHALLAASALETATFNQTLSLLEITGKIRPLGANRWTLR